MWRLTFSGGGHLVRLSANGCQPHRPNTALIFCAAGYHPGFNKIIFIIRKDLEQDFREIIGNRIEKIANVEYAFQELDALPEGYHVTEGRKNPGGTGPAVLTVKNMVHEPLLVINADDYYGREGFFKIHDYMVNEMNTDGDPYDMCMGGFILRTP